MSRSEEVQLFYTMLEKATEKGVINYSQIQEIEFKLKQIPNDQRTNYTEFVNVFLQICFDNNITTDIVKIDFSLVDSENEKKLVSEEVIAEKKQIDSVIITYNGLLKKVVTVLRDYFETYKGYFLIRLENDPSGEYELVFLYEENYFYNPLKKKVEKEFGTSNFLLIDEFHKRTPDEGKNYICIFLLMSKMNDESNLIKLKSKISDIISPDVFETFESYSLIFEKGDIFKIEKTNVRRHFINEIETTLSTFISNTKINFEEEKIIKKLCESFKTPLIFYRLLSGGFSGAKVLEIRPKKSNTFESEKKYIIKFGLNEGEKLKNEIQNFHKYINGFKGFSEYNASYSETLTHEGILYNFAISEKGSNSYPFSEIMNDNCDGLILNKKDIINDLFSLGIFYHWKSEYENKIHKTVKELYENYIDEEKIFAKISEILNINNEEVFGNELCQNFNKIWSYKLSCNEKVCHGDLHTENFFIDNEKNIYLIDFGYTDYGHSLVDFTSLECSVKFKHIPRYIPLDELLQIEEELLNDSTFQQSYNFSNNREKLQEILGIITNIRYCSSSDFINPNESIEYFISLFIMTFRQIQYKDMNQLYAYHSALMLSKKITHNLGL